MSATLRAAIAAAILFAQPVAAQSSLDSPDMLGLTWLEASVTAGKQDWLGQLSGDWKIGPAHGIQLDVALHDHPGGTVGSVGGHLYLSPRPDRKYGFFLNISDVDGRKTTVVHGGVEGLLALTEATTIEARTGIGYASDGYDFISAEAQLRHAFSNRVTVSLGLGLADVQEAALHVTPYQAELALAFSPKNSPLTLTAALVQDGFLGDNADSDTRLQLGVTWRYGETGGGTNRAFTASRPMAALLRRGMF